MIFPLLFLPTAWLPRGIPCSIPRRCLARLKYVTLRQLHKDFGMLLGNPEQGPRRSARRSPPLFPILNRAQANPHEAGKGCLRKMHAACGFLWSGQGF